MIGVLERFELLLLEVEYDPRAFGVGQIGSLFRQMQSRIDAHLRFETDYLLPLLAQERFSSTLSGLLRQREEMLESIAKIERLIASVGDERLAVGAWDELVETALALVRATFTLFHWEERAFIGCCRRA